MSTVTSSEGIAAVEAVNSASRKPVHIHRGMPERGQLPHFDGDHHLADDRTMILLIEPRVLIRECLRRSVGEEISTDVLAVGSLTEWLTGARPRPPAVALLSLSGRTVQDDEDGFDDVRRLLEAYPSLPVVVIADGDGLEDVRLAISHGAKGYIPTSTTPAVAVEAIQLVIAGGVYVPASCLLASPSEQCSPAINRKRLSMFTARQTAVIEALRTGKANKLIAYELNMRESTVKVHVRNIMKRLNAKNRTEVAYLASRIMSGGA